MRSLTALVCGALLFAAVSCSKKTTIDPQVQIEKQGYYYTCTMHPFVREAKAGPCPICQMPMVREELQKAGHADDHTYNIPAGRVPVLISPEKQQLIGVKTEAVQRRAMTHTIRATATFEHDESSMAAIAPRFSGYVRELYVNSEGQRVEKGEPLLKVYSPELVTAENEYLLAKRNGNEELAASARRRLELWQIDDEEIRAMETRGTPSDELLLRAPFSGHVVQKMALQGKAFMAGETLYEIAELHHLWLHAFVYEYELPYVKVGQRARVVVPYYNNKEYDSQITFIYPHIEDTSRRLKLRLEVDNPSHELRPDMWANVVIESDMGEMLVVPASAVIDTGTRSLAFVDKGDGHFEPREVKIAARLDDYYEVMDGVSEGERVVTRALFLIDSESQLKAVAAGMGAAGEHHHGG